MIHIHRIKENWNNSYLLYITNAGYIWEKSCIISMLARFILLTQYLVFWDISEGNLSWCYGDWFIELTNRDISIDLHTLLSFSLVTPYFNFWGQVPFTILINDWRSQTILVGLQSWAKCFSLSFISPIIDLHTY